MLADEYDEFLANPSDFVLRKMMPRMSETMEPMGLFPPFFWMSSGYTMISLLSGTLSAPPVQAMLQRLVEVGQEMGTVRSPPRPS